MHFNVKPTLSYATKQAVELLIKGALVSAIISVEPLLETGTLNWSLIGATFGMSFLIAGMHGVSSYYRPMQPDMSLILDLLSDVIEKKYPVLQASRMLSESQPTPQQTLGGVPVELMNTTQTPVVKAPTTMLPPA